MEKKKVLIPKPHELRFTSEQAVRSIINGQSVLYGGMYVADKEGTTKKIMDLFEQSELYVFTKEELEIEIAKHFIAGQSNGVDYTAFEGKYIRPLNYINSLNLK